MISRRRALQTTLGALAVVMAGRTLDADAQSPQAGPVTRTEIFRQALPNVWGKEVIVVSIEYAPGAGSTKHRHPGPVFAYVARGAIVSQLGTEPPGTYSEGEMWYEAPGAHERDGLFAECEWDGTRRSERKDLRGQTRGRY